jgi:hypothetical protein
LGAAAAICYMLRAAKGAATSRYWLSLY